MNLSTVKPLSFYAKKSTGFHVALVLLACTLSWFSWKAGEEQRKINIKLVQSSVRVDMVALPQKTLKELEAIQTMTSPVAAPKKEEPAPKVVKTPDKGNEFIKKNKIKKKKSFADLLKNYSDKKPAIKKKPKGKSKSKSGLSKKQQALLDGLVKRGNKVQKGESLVGNGSAEVLSGVQSYATKLPSIVKEYWKIPSYLADKGLKARIRVFINTQGRLVRAVIYESSGEAEYDNRALEAVKKASPFPVPEDKISKNILNGDILLGFPL